MKILSIKLIYKISVIKKKDVETTFRLNKNR